MSQLFKYTYIKIAFLLFFIINLIFFSLIKLDSSYIDLMWVLTNIMILILIFVGIYVGKFTEVETNHLAKFLNVTSGMQLKFQDISSFLGEQCFVSFLTTFLIIVGKKIYQEGHGILAGIFIAFITITGWVFVCLSLIRMIFLLNENKFNRLFILFISILMIAILASFNYIGFKIGASTTINW